MAARHEPVRLVTIQPTIRRLKQGGVIHIREPQWWPEPLRNARAVNGRTRAGNEGLAQLRASGEIEIPVAIRPGLWTLPSSPVEALDL